jgi:hypothetical protein
MKTASQKFDEMEGTEPKEEQETPHSEYSEFLDYVKEPMKARTTIPSYAMTESEFTGRPDAGMRSRGKSNDAEATLRKGSLPKSSPVTEAHADNGAAAKEALMKQTGRYDIGSDGAPGVSGNGRRGN